LERTISAFFEELPNRIKQKAYRSSVPLQQFQEEFDRREKQGFAGHWQGQLTGLHPHRVHPMQFIGYVGSMEHDWNTLGEFVRQRAGHSISWPSLPHAGQRKPEYEKKLSVSMLPDSVKQRICHAYRDDYCCLQLPLPEGCKKDWECNLA